MLSPEKHKVMPFLLLSWILSFGTPPSFLIFIRIQGSRRHVYLGLIGKGNSFQLILNWSQKTYPLLWLAKLLSKKDKSVISLIKISLSIKQWAMTFCSFRFLIRNHKVVIELCVVQFWSDIILVIENHAYDFRLNCTPLSSISSINQQHDSQATPQLYNFLHFSLSFFPFFLFKGKSRGLKTLQRTWKTSGYNKLFFGLSIFNSIHFNFCSHSYKILQSKNR